MSLRSSLRTEGISVRSIFTFVLAVIVTAFLWTLIGQTPAKATTAEWNGAALEHQGRQYQLVGKSTGDETHTVPVDSEYYLNIEDVEQANGTGSTPRTQKEYKAHVIYFQSGVSPPSATEATYINYAYDNQKKEFSSPSAATEIAINNDSQASTSSCVVQDVGWIVCGLTRWLATGMDAVFGILSGFMEVQPVNLGNTDSGLYQAWDIMRNIANIAFIIVFLVVIYSQLTSFGVSSYGLKKLLPRLIIAAILVNLSFVISAIAVDISNILGYSLQDIFMYIREDIYSDLNNQSNIINWGDLSEYILTGGAAGLAAGMGIASMIQGAGSVTAGLLYLILPAMVALLLAILTVIIVLAARQAIIIIFIVIAPLAFVANLLPNTEKWFAKWKDVFLTMLIFFPAFSVVFGGSQLAGIIIIENATSLNIVILGMIVQVAPLVITPLLIKFSGGLLGKITGMVNNPNKGLADRTRKWADQKKELSKYRSLGELNSKGGARPIKKRQVGRRLARRMENRQKLLEQMTGNAKASYENKYHASKEYAKLHEQAHEIGMDKEDIDNKHKAHINSTMAQGGRLYGKNIELEKGKRAVEMTQARMESGVHTALNDKSSSLHLANVATEAAKLELEEHKATAQRMSEEYRSGKLTINASEAGGNTEALRQAAESMSKTQVNISAEARAMLAAKQLGQTNYGETIEVDVDVNNRAGGIDPNGAQRALAEALSIISKNKKENIDNIKTIISYKNLTDNEKKSLIEGESVKDIAASVEARAAAIESMFEAASPSVVSKLIEEVDFDDVIDEKERMMLFGSMAKGLESSKLRPAFFDFGRIANLRQGIHKIEKITDEYGNVAEEVTEISGSYGEAGMNDMIMDVVKRQTLTTAAMQDMFTPYVNQLKRAIDTQNLESIEDEETAKGLAELKKRIDTVLNPEREGYDKLGDSKQVYVKIRSKLEELGF